MFSRFSFLLDAAAADTATTGTAGQEANIGSLLASLLPLLILFALMYLLMIRPQKKREKQITDMRNSLQVGDIITTNGGIVGKIVNIKDDEVTIESGIENTKLLFKNWAVRGVERYNDEDKPAAE